MSGLHVYSFEDAADGVDSVESSICHDECFVIELSSLCIHFSDFISEETSLVLISGHHEKQFEFIEPQ
jgi:hypothetical protein